MNAPTLSPAEAIAASLCWLASMGSPIGGRAEAQVKGYWHNRACRWCRVPRPELMARIESSWADPRFADAVKAFDRSPGKTRLVKEAQERPWYDEVTASERGVG